MKNNNSALKIAGVYTGAILGAGFASGKELIVFFARFGIWAAAGLVLSGILFYLAGKGIFDFIHKTNSDSYDFFIDEIFGKKIGTFVKIVSFLFLITLFSTMIAAGGEILSLIKGINVFYGRIIMTSLCFLAFLFDVKGLVQINMVMCPIIIAGGIFIGLYVFIKESGNIELYNNGFYNVTDNFVLSSFLYTSYNIITIVPVLISMKKYSSDLKTGKKGCFIASLTMTVLGLFMILPYFSLYGKIQEANVPIIKLAENYPLFIKITAAAVLFSAAATTACANGFETIKRLEEKAEKNSVEIKLLTCILGFLISSLGFRAFVEKIYPLFGFIGLFELFSIITGIHVLKKHRV